MLTGCGGSLLQIGAPGAMPQSRAIATHTERGGSWMLPEAKSEDLLYISDGISGDVLIFSYPEGKKIGKITGLARPEGTCIDLAQNVFVVIQGSGYINEYAHGGTKPIGRLRDLHGESDSALGCSVSPTTGDLAVVNQSGPSYNSSSYGPPNVVIYRAAHGKPKVFSDQSLLSMYFCGYDDEGNLFVDGTSYEYPFSTVLVELPKGGKTFKNVALRQTIHDPGGVQWDGEHLAVGDRTGASGAAVVYRFAIKHRQARTVGVMPLQGDTYIVSFWILGSRFIGGSLNYGTQKAVEFWHYPAGGQPIKTLTGFADPAAMTISLAPSR